MSVGTTLVLILIKRFSQYTLMTPGAPLMSSLKHPIEWITRNRCSCVLRPSVAFVRRDRRKRGDVPVGSSVYLRSVDPACTLASLCRTFNTAVPFLLRSSPRDSSWQITFAICFPRCSLCEQFQPFRRCK